MSLPNDVPNDFDAEFDRLATEMFARSDAERQQEIRNLGHPEWCVSTFQQLRRLGESINRGRQSPTVTEILQRIEKILSQYPQSFFAYDDACTAEVEAAFAKLKDAIERA